MINCPKKCWVLGGTFIPKQVVITRKGSWGTWYRSESGKEYLEEQLFLTKAEALAYGEERLQSQEVKMRKQQDGIDKKRANLAKHSQ